MTPNYRRTARRLTPAEVAELVALRDRGATWKEVGRRFAKQDTACKSIYDRAKGLPEPART